MIVNFNEIAAQLVSAVLSWLDASNLRNQLFEQRNRMEILETALEDIERINRASVNPNYLIEQIVLNTRRNHK